MKKGIHEGITHYKQKQQIYRYNKPEHQALIHRVHLLLNKGWKQKDIAVELGITPKTVYRYKLAAERIRLQEQHLEKKELQRTSKGYTKVSGINEIEFCTSSKFLGMKLFPMQELILKAFYGLPLEKQEKAILLSLRKQDKTTWEEGEEYSELVVDAGMKGGKTRLASLIACIEEFSLYKLGDFSSRYGFPLGQEVFIINVATSQRQALDTIFACIKDRIQSSPYYETRRRLRESEFEFRFDNSVIMRSGHANSASLVGKLAKLVEFDELARFTDTKGRYSAERVYYSLNRSPAPFGDDGKTVSISSPIEKKDMITNLYELSKEVPGMLGFHLATWEMNPNLPFNCTFLQRALKKNAENFWRDFGAQPPEAVEAYYRLTDRIDEAFILGNHMGLKQGVDSEGRFYSDFRGDPRYAYYLHGDPAVRNDCFGIGMAHAEGDKVVVDLAYRFEPGETEIDMEEVKNFLLEIAERFNLVQVSFDTWQAAGITQALQKKNVPYKNLYVLKDIHDLLKEKIYAREVALPPYPLLGDELKGLVLRAGRKVDHSSKKSKDVADSVAAAVYFASQDVSTPLQAIIGGRTGNIFVTPESYRSPWMEGL